MIRFVARRTSGKSALGLVLLPADLARILSGEPVFTELATLDIECSRVESIGVYFFRDAEELQEALKEAGADPRMFE